MVLLDPRKDANRRRLMEERGLFGMAVELLRRGERVRACYLLLQVVLDDPGCTLAWLWLSGLVDDIAQKRKCLIQALASDPNCAPAIEGLEVLRLRELLADIPVQAPEKREKQRNELPDIPMPQQLGEYLVLENIIAPEQLVAALTRQVSLQQSGTHVKLGELLIHSGYLTPAVLKRFLEQQRQKIFIDYAI